MLTVQSYTRVAALLAASIDVALLRTGVEYFDFLLLGMWNRPPGKSLIDAAEHLVEKGKVRHLMMSTHNRSSLQEHFLRYAAKESPFDAFMLRYNAANRGAEHDVFPHLPESPRPGIVSYTATRWGQLLDPKKMPAGKRIGGYNQQVDLMPTLLELAGIKTEITFEGKSLMPMAKGKKSSHASSFYITECTWMRKHGWRTPEWKLIVALEPDFHFKPEVELYNLIEDPDENRNVA